MNVVLVIACIGLITGSFVLFSISPMEFTNSIFKNFLGKPRSIKDEINEATKRKKMSFFRREVTEVQDILKLTGRGQKFPALCAISLFLFAAGCTIAGMLDNIFLKDIAAELETALSIMTTAYLRTEDILTAVEENINYLNPPVLSVFKGFVYRIKMINPDIAAGLQDMRGQIENAVFREWCDALIACQLDRNLKTTLTPIVTKLSDMRVVNGELENMVFEPRKEFIAMQILVIGNIPLLYFLNKDWYHTLMHTAIGQIILAICFTAIFISAAFVIRLTQPIEYRR